MCFKKVSKDSKMAEYIMMNSYVPVDRVIGVIQKLDADGNGLIRPYHARRGHHGGERTVQTDEGVRWLTVLNVDLHS